MSTEPTVGSSEVKVRIIRKSVPDFVTVTPWSCTDSGSCVSASCTLFCTCICATSASVPAAKLSDTRERPAEVDSDDMLCRPSRPCMRCSITCVTESSTVCADAPV